MASTQLESDALRRAELASEERRIVGLLVVFALIGSVAVTRALLFGAPDEAADLPRALVLLALFTGYELVMLRTVRRAREGSTYPGRWVWMQSVVAEASMPTLAILQLTEGPYLGPYRALVTPALAAYYLLLALSTLRLSPRQSRLMGAVAAAGYLGVAAYTWLRYPDHPVASGHSLEIVTTHAAFLLIGGFVAGAVAGQIRGHVAAALREARRVERMEHDLELARSIQQSLLPASIPEVAGFAIAGWNQPADQTGGDYYDCQQLSDGRMVITLADVTGHGIGPALVAAVSRAYGRANFPIGEDLSQAMRRINAQLSADLPPGKLVQLVSALLAPERASIDLLSAGHGPLLVFRAAEATFEHLNAHGIPFGVAGAFPYGSGARIDMDPGDMLILVTDGFFEWERADGEQFGLEALERAIREAAELPPAGVIERMYDSVRAFAEGEPQQDDLTAVVVRRVGGD